MPQAKDWGAAENVEEEGASLETGEGQPWKEEGDEQKETKAMVGWEEVALILRPPWEREMEVGVAQQEVGGEELGEIAREKGWAC